MRERLRNGLSALDQRLHRIERRRLQWFRRWLERTSNLLHLSVLLFVPLVVIVTTAIANVTESLSFLLFPPLAAGTYTLFANPESRYATPSRFVGGLTAGALCGWFAMELAVTGPIVRSGGATSATGPLAVDAVAAGVAVLLTGTVTWALDIEEAGAFSTALLGLLVPEGDVVTFVVSVFVASTIVATVFAVWRTYFYERRARLLYESVDGGDRILVPMHGENPEETAMLAGRLAAAHEAGTVALLDYISDDDIDREKRALRNGDGDDRQPVADGGTDTEGGVAEIPTEGTEGGSDDAGDTRGGPEPTTPVERAERRIAAESAARLERVATAVESETGVPCQTVAATGSSMAATVRRVAHDTDCDLIAASYEEDGGGLAPGVGDLFECELDVVVHHSNDGRTDWSDVLVPVRQANDLAHSMLDVASRLAGDTGRLSAAKCVGGERQRRRAEEILTDLAETTDRAVETRVSTAPVESFLSHNAGEFDLVVIGASTDRSNASRFVSPPTFERVGDLDADVVIVDRP